MTETYITSFETPIGWLQIGSTESIVTAIDFVEERAEEPQSIPPILVLAKQELTGYFNGDVQPFSFLVQLQGTKFQKEVWRAVSNIALGNTCSYGALAKEMNQPKAVRAVSNANAQNILAVVVPCHRIIGGDGSLTGYKWGLARKQWLLEHEAKITNQWNKLF